MVTMPTNDTSSLPRGRAYCESYFDRERRNETERRVRTTMAQRVLVIRGGAIGDFILTLPALGALRQALPEADIEVWGQPHRAILAQHPAYANRITDLDRWNLYRLFSRRAQVSEPLADRAPDNPWPEWPRILRVDYGYAEVAARFGSDPRVFGILSKRFLDDGSGGVAGLETVAVDWARDDSGRFQMTELPGTEATFDADLVLGDGVSRTREDTG